MFQKSAFFQLFPLLLILYSGCRPQGDVSILILAPQDRQEGSDTLIVHAKPFINHITNTDDTGFLSKELQGYQILILFNFVSSELNAVQKANLRRFVQAGGRMIAIGHAGLPKYHWPWLSHQIGAYLKFPPGEIKEPGSFAGTDTNEPGTTGPVFEIADTFLRPVDILETINTESRSVPVSWISRDGRAGYIAISSPEHELFATSFEGILEQMATKRLRLNYDRVTDQPFPQENRFIRTILAQNLYEPMELEILPDGKVLIIERRGLIKMYDPVLNLMNIVTKLAVHHEHEDGLLGIAVDPEYYVNKWIYLLYSPVGPDPKQHVSRFVFDDRLFLETEKVLLQIPTQREECCHSAGCLEFGPDGLLYIATGDNTNPFGSDGFSPIDEREGRISWDARRTSGNSNDLRGKILRIKPEPDGTYSIPEGNLFTHGEPLTRPEIYIMGCRNPFRISVDEKTNYLYWGDVGPDAGLSSQTRGPKGLDEINQARHAGNWGWPFTRGNNQPYFDYNFETVETETLFDANNLINSSVNNTGIQNIPAAQESMIWYSYDRSEEFPWLGTGGKNPMAGPVYYSQHYKNAPDRFPSYFDGKLFFYEWMRDYIYIIHLDSMGRYMQADPFMPNSVFSNPMDMKFGPDGDLYVIEYGESWYTRNLDARLNRISYVKGNRQPIARITLDKETGALPLSIRFSGEGSTDFDGDSLRYEWDFDQEGSTKIRRKTSEFTFTKPGVYRVRLTVTDPKGASGYAVKEVFAGNDPPEIAIDLFDQPTFYWDNRTMKYKISVDDVEDGSTSDGSIDHGKVTVTFNYIEQGGDLTRIAHGHQVNLPSQGASMVSTSDCNSCHALDRRINGPSYHEIAERYSLTDVPQLVEKVHGGGAGVWGETAMSAHPQLSLQTIEMMIEYILSLKPKAEVMGTIPLEGTLIFDKHLQSRSPGNYILMVSYTDKGAGTLQPLTNRRSVVFAPPWLEAEAYDRSKGLMRTVQFDDMTLLVEVNDEYNIRFNQVDLTGVTGLGLKAVYNGRHNCAGFARVSAMRNGEIISLAELDLTWSTENFQVKTWITEIPAIQGHYDLIIGFHYPEDPSQLIVNMDKILLFFNQDTDQPAL